MESMHTVRVTGKGVLHLKPDTTRISLTLTGVDPAYADALAHCEADTQAVRDALAALGFSKDDLKTLQFSVDAEYEGCDDHGVYKNRFVGFRYRHACKVEFASDNALLGRVLYALAHGAAQPELSIAYTVRDAEAAKNRLIDAAVSDARAKAQVLAEAAHVALGEILSIDYARSEADLAVRPMQRNLLMKAEAADASYRFDIEPDDIEASDTVTIVCRIG